MSNETITLPLDVVKAWRDAYEQASIEGAKTRIALRNAVEAALWQPPKTVVQWIECSEHPHPIKTKVLYLDSDGYIGATRFGALNPRVVRWAWLDGITGVQS